MLLALLQTATRHTTTAQRAGRTKAQGLIHLVAGLGFVGLFAIAIADASFIPLPIPACTDILLVFMAARQKTWLMVALLALTATVGSMIGGYLSYRVGAAGGLHMLEKRVSKKHLARMCDWMQNHAILAVSLPALLPPPMPMSIFVLAAGALKIPPKKFMTVFTLSRAFRHGLWAWVGMYYGRHVLRLWNSFSAAWGMRIEIALWVVITLGIAYAVWTVWQHGKHERERRRKKEPVWERLAEDV